MFSGERRLVRRFEIHVPLLVHWETKAAMREAITEAKDISSRGIYFLVPADIEKDATIEIVMVLPHEITLASSIKVRCKCRVQRTEPQAEGKAGVAVAIEGFEFLRNEKTAA